MPRLLVIAADYPAYKQYCQENKLGVADALYLHRDDQVRGRTKDEFVRSVFLLGWEKTKSQSFLKEVKNWQRRKT